MVNLSAEFVRELVGIGFTQIGSFHAKAVRGEAG
jgi:hypothetical protein